jgi:hypothetical protein
MLAMTEPTDEALRDWLLGRLPSAEAEALERRVLGEDAFGARLDEIELDLLDDLAAGRLAGDTRASALARFTATPRARLRLRIARALSLFGRRGAAHPSHRTTEDRRAHRRRGWIAGVLGATAAVAIAVAGLNLRAPAPHAPPATITLLADRQRGSEAESIAIAKDATSVRMQLEVDDAGAATRYALEIEAADRVVYSANDLAPRTAGAYRFVEAEVPRRVLAGGERVVRVHASAVYTRSWTLRLRDE